MLSIRVSGPPRDKLVTPLQGSGRGGRFHGIANRFVASGDLISWDLRL
jgi:hypothetical protein